MKLFDAIKQYILNAEAFKIGAGAETSSITGLAQRAIDANGGLVSYSTDSSGLGVCPAF